MPSTEPKQRRQAPKPKPSKRLDAPAPPPKHHNSLRALRTPELEETILERLTNGRTLYSVSCDPDIPTSQAILQWADKDEAWASKLARARTAGWELLLESSLDIADDLSDRADSRRVRIDSRLKTAAALMPARFGSQSIDITSKGQSVAPALDDMNLVTAAARILHMLDQARRAHTNTIQGEAIHPTLTLTPPSPD